MTLNRAIAVAELEGPQPALALLDPLELDDYRYYHSTRADLLRRLGGDYFRKRDPERITKRLVAQLESLGHKVILEELPQAA